VRSLAHLLVARNIHLAVLTRLSQNPLDPGSKRQTGIQEFRQPGSAGAKPEAQVSLVRIFD